MTANRLHAQPILCQAITTLVYSVVKGDGAYNSENCWYARVLSTPAVARLGFSYRATIKYFEKRNVLRRIVLRNRGKIKHQPRGRGNMMSVGRQRRQQWRKIRRRLGGCNVRREMSIILKDDVLNDYSVCATCRKLLRISIECGNTIQRIWPRCRHGHCIFGT